MKKVLTFQNAPGTVLLVGGRRPSEGNVWVTNKLGQLGPVCDRLWDKNDADVVCRQLGYKNGGKPTRGGKEEDGEEEEEEEEEGE